MKIFFGIVIVAVFTALGYLLGLKYLDRKKFFGEFLAFNKKLLDEISLNNITIKEFLEKNKTNTDFYNYILEGFSSNEFDFSKSYLKPDEKAFFIDYVRSLGKGELESEKVNLSSYNEKLTEKNNLVFSEEKKYRPLFIKLGFFIGLIVFIIIL